MVEFGGRYWRRQFGKISVEAKPYWALVIFLIVTVLIGGSSRADTQSLIILRPLATIFCGIGLWSLRWHHVRENRFLFGMAAAIFALVISHLIPLPPALWGALPGRDILTEVDRLGQLGAVWRPVAMVPSAGWNAFYSLFVPLAVLILAVQLSREERFKLLFILLGLGLLSGLWAIAQISGPPDGPFYLYADGGSVAEGLLRNRNHQATLLALLFPMLAVFATAVRRPGDKAKVRVWMALGAGVVLVPLILLTGSRAGLIFGIIGLVSILVIYRPPEINSANSRTTLKFNGRYALLALAVLCLGGLSLFLSRAEALTRLVGRGQPDDDRAALWQPVAHMAWKYFPVGSGVGSFVEVYQIDEPNELLSQDYFNHAHNDWLEVYMTAGLPGLILLILAVVVFLRMSVRAFRVPGSNGRDVAYARLGSVMIAIFALASVPDYPLRVPSLMSVFVIAAIWLSNNAAAKRKNAGIA